MRATPVPEALAYSGRLVDPAHLERLEVLGPTIQFVADPVEESAPCVMRGTIPPGVSVPLHSHADPETLLSLSGELRGLTFRGEDFEWIEIRPGDVFHVPGGAKHAFRNDARKRPASCCRSNRAGRS